MQTRLATWSEGSWFIQSENEKEQVKRNILHYLFYDWTVRVHESHVVCAKTSVRFYGLVNELPECTLRALYTENIGKTT